MKICAAFWLFTSGSRLQHVIIISAVALKEFLILLGKKLELVFVSHGFVAEKLSSSKVFSFCGQEIHSARSKRSKALPSFLFSSIHSVRHSIEVSIPGFHLVLHLSIFGFTLLFSESISLTPKSEEEWPFLLHAQFTPRGHSLVMVYNYDIYYKTGPKSAQSFRITKTAVPGIIYNGVPDWLYEGWLNSLTANHVAFEFFIRSTPKSTKFTTKITRKGSPPNFAILSIGDE